MEKKLKKNVRLIRAKDAIWMFLAAARPEFIRREWDSVLVGRAGAVVQAREFEGATRIASFSWEDVAGQLGCETCELVEDPDGIGRVLLYDEENEKDNTKGTMK